MIVIEQILQETLLGDEHRMIGARMRILLKGQLQIVAIERSSLLTEELTPCVDGHPLLCILVSIDDIYQLRPAKEVLQEIIQAIRIERSIDRMCKSVKGFGDILGRNPDMQGIEKVADLSKGPGWIGLLKSGREGKGMGRRDEELAGVRGRHDAVGSGRGHGGRC